GLTPELAIATLPPLSDPGDRCPTVASRNRETYLGGLPMTEERDRKRAGSRRVLLLSAVTVAAAMALVPAAGAGGSGSVPPPAADRGPGPATHDGARSGALRHPAVLAQ